MIWKDKFKEYLSLILIFIVSYIPFFLILYITAQIDLASHPYIKDMKWHWWLIVSKHCLAAAIHNEVWWPFFFGTAVFSSFTTLCYWINKGK